MRARRDKVLLCIGAVIGFVVAEVIWLILKW